MDKQIELLPCPWCGSEGAMAHNGYSDIVICSNNDCPMDESWNRDSEEAAAVAWNTRTTPTPPAGQVEAVARAIYGYLGYAPSDGGISAEYYGAAQEAIKASGAEHIAGLVQALEGIIARPDQNDTQWKQGRKAGLAEALAYIKEALPPELRGK